MIVWPFFAALGATALALKLLIPALRRAGITGRDMHKPGRPEVPEMGGLALVAGFVVGILLAIALETFWQEGFSLEVPLLLAALAAVLIIALIGIVDDLLNLPQNVKAALPLLASLPLIAMEAGQTRMLLPFWGWVDFGWTYPFLLVPLGITGAANATNMLAGFNGLETGMGLVALGSLSWVAAHLGETTSLIVLLVALATLLAMWPWNAYPAKVFLGDVGTLFIGAVIATAVILGNFEAAGAIVIVPYAADFLFKALSGFPSQGWWGELGQDGKLRCPAARPVSLCQGLMLLCGGLHERTLVWLLIGIEALFGGIAVWLYGL